MAETLHEFQAAISSSDGVLYAARACGAETPGGLWEGWIEFVPETGGEPLRSPRETTQPNRTDILYWATGITPVYLEGALWRAQHPLLITRPAAPRPPAFSEPARPVVVTQPETPHSVLDPFSVYEKGEGLLRSQLASLASWHLVNIIRDYELSAEDPAVLNSRTSPELIERIVAGVRAERRQVSADK
jgi:hypothetical protein